MQHLSCPSVFQRTSMCFYAGLFRKNGSEKKFLDCMSRMDKKGERLDDILQFPDQAQNNYIAAQLIKAFFREYEIPSPGYLPLTLLEATEDSDIQNEFDKIGEPLKSMILWLLDLVIEVEPFSLCLFLFGRSFAYLFLCAFCGMVRWHRTLKRI